MMHDDKKVGSVAMILRKMRGGSSSSSMKESNEIMVEAPTNEFGEEVHTADAIDAAAEGLILAVERKDRDAVKRSLRTFIELIAMESTEETSEHES